MKKILIIIAALALVAVSCDKTPKNEPVEATVALTLDGAPYAEADITVTLRELRRNLYNCKLQSSCLYRPFFFCNHLDPQVLLLCLIFQIVTRFLVRQR